MRSQNGSAIVMLFIAVALFGALAYAFMKGSRTSTSMMTDEASKAQTTSAQMQGVAVSGAVKRLKLKGCKDSEISYETPAGNNPNPSAPADGRCHVYKVNGGGIRFVGDDSAPAATSKTVFVTSTVHNGNVGGVTGADSICATRASAAGLIGTYKAWISTASSSPAASFTQSSLPYKRVDGTTVADNWADLTDGSLDNAINKTETGGAAPTTFVLTNTTISGTPVTLISNGMTCDFFTSSGAIEILNTGRSTVTGSTWTDAAFPGQPECGTSSFALYCFQQ